jgi:hypothetical protein
MKCSSKGKTGERYIEMGEIRFRRKINRYRGGKDEDTDN